MSPLRRRSKVERLRQRGDVRRLVALLHRHDWLVDRAGVLIDLEVGRRIQAVNALGAIGGEAGEDALLVALEDSDPRVRVAAVAELGPRPGHGAAKTLARAAATWRHPELREAREAAVTVLVELADEVHAVCYGETLVEDGGRASLTPDEEQAVRRLFAADSGPVAEVFAAELTQELGADGSGRALEGQMLVAMGPISVRPLVSALQHPTRRSAAAAALGGIRDVRAVPALVDLLSTPDPTVRLRAARALGEIRDPQALEPLIHASADENAEVRDAALEALDGMRSVITMLGAAAAVISDGPPQIQPLMGEPEILARLGIGQRALLRRLRGRPR